MQRTLSKAIMVSLAVAITAAVGAASVSYAANGKPFILGKINAATAVSTFVKQGPGPDLRLLVRPGNPPMAVNSGVRVTNLNADRVDGREATSFAASSHDHDARYLGKAEKAADADRLDGFEANGLSRVAFEQRGGLVVIGVNETMANEEIIAPTDGFLVINASSVVENTSARDVVSCEMRVDGDQITASRKLAELNGDQNINETEVCATGDVEPVAAGTYEISFEAGGVNSGSTTFANPSLWAIFVPFDENGEPPRQSE